MKKFLIVLILLSLSLNGFPAITIISPDALQSWITAGTGFDFILVDVRNENELSSGIIATDQCKPYNFSLTNGILEAMAPSFPKSVPVIVYCQLGGRAATAASKLDSAGIKQVYCLATGNGFGTWTGTTRDKTFLKDPGLFPEPSMRAALMVINFSVPLATQSRFHLQPVPVLSLGPYTTFLLYGVSAGTYLDLRGRNNGGNVTVRSSLYNNK